MINIDWTDFFSADDIAASAKRDADRAVVLLAERNIAEVADAWEHKGIASATDKMRSIIVTQKLDEKTARALGAAAEALAKSRGVVTR